jgi:3-(methylthio)propanoyl-CoA dehydrogenase
MTNWYKNTPEIELRIDNSLMRHIVDLKENGFSDAKDFDYAPKDFEDALDNYNKILELTGEICENTISKNAECVDKQGAKCEKGRVSYADGTKQNIKIMHQAGFSGVGLPRRFGGMNLPVTVFCAIAEMISRADASFQNIWGLQSCADTVYEFGDDAQRDKFLCRVCKGETMSMDLTEPDAGSDLQSVSLKATFSEEESCWYLNGVKRFITNGDADIHLVLARSEEGTNDGRGLSLFIYDKKDGGVDVRRIEDKMGIHGSPTCELVFHNAKAEICGSRRLGLIKYVMSLMNGARLGIAAQSIGISDAAWHEAVNYAIERRQFDKSIIEFPAVYQMIALIKAKLEASRSLLYETARYVDIYKSLDDIAKYRKLTPEEREESKRYSKMADALTPLAKGMCSEFANQNAYDCIQVHGGSGFMRDYACERLYRDARITSIYEGTTQLQVVASIRYVTNKSYSAIIEEINSYEADIEFASYKERIVSMTSKFNEVTDIVNEERNTEYTDFHARCLMEMASHCIMSSLLLKDTIQCPEILKKSMTVYLDFAEAEIEKNFSFIKNFDKEHLDSYKQ